MKLFLYFLLSFVTKIFSFPLPDDRIIFRDDDYDGRVDDSVDDIRFDQTRLLSDSNLLKSDNLTREFLYDERAQQKFENGQFFQGDIILQQEQIDILKYPDDDDPFGTRTGVLSENYRWPKNKNGKVIVPYEFSSDYSKYLWIKIECMFNLELLSLRVSSHM